MSIQDDIDQFFTMSDTGADLEPFLPQPSTLRVSAARALYPLTRSDGDGNTTRWGSSESAPVL